MLSYRRMINAHYANNNLDTTHDAKEGLIKFTVSFSWLLEDQKNAIYDNLKNYLL